MIEFESPWYGFVIGALAVWRLTHLAHVEHGPWGLFNKLRAAADRRGIGEVFKCFFCLSLWTAVPVVWLLESGWPERIVAWLGLSAAAIVLERMTLGSPNSPGASGG